MASPSVSTPRGRNLVLLLLSLDFRNHLLTSYIHKSVMTLTVPGKVAPGPQMEPGRQRKSNGKTAPGAAAGRQR
jgi:hypothetical protein